MSGPWEAFQQQQPVGPWTAFQADADVVVPQGPAAQSLSDAIVAGLQNSATGLALRGKLPDVNLEQNAPWHRRIAAGAAGMLADLPVSIVGAVAGAPVGAAAGSAVPVIGTAAGGVVGAGAGAFAAPMALRDGLIEAYSNNHAASWAGVWDIAKASLKGGTKGAVIGGATMGAGRLVAPVVAPALGGAVAKGAITPTAARVGVSAAEFGTELTALTTLSAGVEGHMPTAQDFLDNAILLGGMKTAVKTAQTLRTIYAETGKLPEEVLSDVRRGVVAEAELQKAEMPEAYKPLALEERIKASIDADPRPEALRQMFSQDTPPKLGEKPIADPVRYEYVTDRATLQGVIRGVSELYAKEMTAQRRGEVPNEITIAAGVKMAAEGKMAEHVLGTAENAAQLAARIHILRGVTRDAFDAVQALKGISEAEMTPVMKLKAIAAMEKVAMVKRDLEGAGAEAGRALQIFSAAKRDPTVFGEVDGLIKLYERKGSLSEIAAMVDSLKDPAQLARFADGYVKATKSEMVIEAWKAAILSGPQTHMANILGNIGRMLVDVPESALAATIEGVRRAGRGDPMSMAQFKARALSPWNGLRLGAVDGLKIAGEVLRQKGEHLEKADVFRTAIPGKTGEVVRIPFRLLQAEDVLFRTMAERAKAYEMAVDRATKEARHPDTAEFRETVAKYLNEPTAGLSEGAALKAVEAIQTAGAEAVFAQRLGPRMELVQKAMQGFLPAQLVVPFVRTPTNLVSWAIQHTPGLNLLSARWRADFAAGGERQSRAIARVVVGAGLTLTAFQLAQDGILTGGGMFDPEQRRTKTAAGWQPYSLKVGDKYYSYQRLEPVAKVLGVASDMIEMFDRLESKEQAKAMPLLVLMFGNMTISTTYLSGLSNAMQAATDPARYGENWFEQYASSLVPKIVGQTAAAIDPHKREVDGVVDAIQAQVPIWREQLMPKRDAWGEPSANDKWFSVMPVQVTTASTDKVKTEAVRLQVALVDAPKFLTEKGPFKPGDKRIDLTPEQRDIIRQVSGGNAMEILRPIVNAPDWERIPDFAKAEVYKRVFEATRKQGQFAALPGDAAERAAVRQKIVDKITSDVSKAEGK